MLQYLNTCGAQSFFIQFFNIVFYAQLIFRFYEVLEALNSSDYKPSDKYGPED